MWGSDLSGSIQGAGGVGGLLGVSYRGTATTNCFVAYDGNGDVAALVNAADGTSVANYEYGPFGEVIRQTGPMAKANPLRFSTKYQDDESDLLYYGYRYYKASTGTWVSRDPIDEASFLLSYLKSLNLDDGAKLKRRMPDGNEFDFLQNNPIYAYDLNGLLAPAPVAGACVRGTAIVAGEVGEGALATVTLPATAVVLSVVVVGEITYITYELCQCRRQWACNAKCQLVRISDFTVVGYHYGTGTGSTQDSACDAAKTAAANSAPPGFYTRHCRCICQQ